jgi:hypothetical protein
VSDHSFVLVAKKRNVARVKILLKHGAHRNPRDDRGRTRLELSRNNQVARLLEKATWRRGSITAL